MRAAFVATLMFAAPAVAQMVPHDGPSPGEPRLLPPLGLGRPIAVPPSSPQPNAFSPSPSDSGHQAEQPRTGPHPDPTVQLPQPEKLITVDPSTVSLRQLNDSWQLWAGAHLLQDFGHSAQNAQDAWAAVRGLRPTKWGVIGSPRPVVEYGLIDGSDRLEPPRWSANPKQSLPLDLKTVRAEPVRGTWVVRDDRNILLNFGPARADAEQAAMVAKRYGFNRVGLIGSPNPSMAYFFAAQELPGKSGAADDPFVQLARAAQEASLTRTAIDVPGVGLVGERLTLEPRLLDVRKDRGEWVLANGPDVIARFGYSEMYARDALRVVKDARLSEFCKVGGLTFVLSNGQAPTRVSYAAQRDRFDFTRLVTREAPGGGWAVYEGGGKMLFPAGSREEAEVIIKVIVAYRFDQVCQVGTSPKASLRFLAKAGR